MAPYLFDQRNVADTETEKEARRIRFRQSILRGGRRHRIAGVNVGDSCGDDYSAGSDEQ
jgi:hypothetical protein